MSALAMTACAALVTMSIAPVSEAATLHDETVEDWERYVAATEARIASELADGERFLVRDALAPAVAEGCRRDVDEGSVCLIELSTRDQAGDPLAIRRGLVHHWLGSIFVPGVELAALVEWLQDVEQQPASFTEVEQGRTLWRDGDELTAYLRLARTKVVTVHYATEHRVSYRRHDPMRVSSRSGSTRIAEIEHAGEADEREKPPGDDRGFLWRLNAYWRFQAVPGGVLVECESLSLSRAVPRGLGWLVSRFVESVPRESMTSTLEALRAGAPRR